MSAESSPAYNVENVIRLYVKSITTICHVMSLGLDPKLPDILGPRQVFNVWNICETYILRAQDLRHDRLKKFIYITDEN